MRLYPTCVPSSGLRCPRQGPTCGRCRHRPPLRFITVPTSVRSRESREEAAAERLERPECRQVLSDFRDASGRTMQEKLDALGDTPRHYLTRLTFREE